LPVVPTEYEADLMHSGQSITVWFVPLKNGDAEAVQRL
jgi:hypothetical protein